MRALSILGLVAVIFSRTVGATVAAEPSRRAISLDGVWQIAEGKMEQVPASFERTAPVPGLVSLATPAFADPPGPKVADCQRLSQKDPRRDSFWYRRTFTVDGPIPAVATLKIAKAMFGTRVFLNGKLLGDHAPCFTPGYFDAKPALKTGENEIAIRIGADRDAVGRAHPDGFDFEKDRYIPGIFDSVGLILSGTPHFENVQVAPDIATGAVRVQAKLHNAGELVTATCAFIVREAKSGKVVGKIAADRIKMAKGGETTVDVRVPIAGCRLWSPEDPFLYTLEADSGKDTFQTRFGMREFRFDFATRRAMLNGKPYFMRGCNFTLYRFFEDSECKDLPWRRDWVRLLHQRVKEMHWNCLRYCIGFPPEAWYDVADEMGILIEDEFPIWFGGDVPNELSRDELAREYSEWLRDRWNHPCVVVWDACNETLSPKTGPALERYDRSISRAAPGTTAILRRRGRAICLNRIPTISTAISGCVASLPPIRSPATANTRSSSTNTVGTGSTETARRQR
jgi:beta-galactosidase/beta-glucuronidase